VPEKHTSTQNCKSVTVRRKFTIR